MLKPAVDLTERRHECEHKNIDTPEVKAALDLLEPLCREQEWIVHRRNLHATPDPTAPWNNDREGRQQAVRVCFSGIYKDVRWPDQQTGRLESR